jgi:uncharacterized protein (DUF849 family)
MNQKTIVTCAITGSGTSLQQTPHLPITPDQIAESGLEAAEAGASILHIHVRDPQTGEPSMNLEYYQKVFEIIKKNNPDVLINFTTGPGATGPSDVVLGKSYPEKFCNALQRLSHVIELKPDICTLDFNVMNRGNKNITVNSIDIVKQMALEIKKLGIKPELEIFDTGDLHVAKMLINEGFINDPMWQICTGIKWGWQSSIETLEYAKKLLPIDAVWTAFGLGSWQMPFVALSVIGNGNVRVGLEDNIYIKKGILAKSNSELVNKAVGIITSLGGNIAKPKDTRLILNIE